MRAKEFVIEAKDSNDPTGQIAVHDQGMAIPVASQYAGDGQFKVTIKNKPYIVTVAGFEIDDNSPGNLDSFYLTDVATGKTEHVTSGWNYPEAVAIFNNLLTNQLPALKQIYKQDMELGRRTDWQEQPERLQGLKPSGYNAIPGDRFIKAHDDMKRVTGQDVDEAVKQRLDPKCWKGKHKEGTKIKGGVRVNNCVPNESVNEGQQLSVQQLATISDAALDSAYGYGRSSPGNTFGWQANLKSAAFAKQMIDRGVTDIEAISDAIHKGWNVTAQAFVKNPDQFDDSKTMAPEKLQAKIAQRQKLMTQQYAQLPEDEKEKDRVVARAMLQAITGQQELSEEFDLIESIIHTLAERNQVDSEVIWEDLESLTDDELYVFATTTTIMETEAWQKANKRDKTDGMSRKAVKTYRREHPGSKLKTAVTTKPSKLKKGSKASKRRKSYCSRSRGQMKMHNISCAKTPDKAICKARRRWNC